MCTNDVLPEEYSFIRLQPRVSRGKTMITPDDVEIYCLPCSNIACHLCKCEEVELVQPHPPIQTGYCTLRLNIYLL